jgi:meso-butanediol dehydrogenase / (S,S)-butanediol dehydrogenase / diacetyl reductase
MSQHLRERAIVTGATSGIGRAIAVKLGSRGAAVGLIGRNSSAADLVAEEVRGAGGEAIILLADVRKADELEAAVKRFVTAYGGVNTVVASAGIALTGRVTDGTLADWDDVISTNVNGTFFLARFAMPELLKTRGTFTAISSTGGVWGARDYSAYCTSKFALNGLIKCLALDYGPDGVRSNSVCPAFTETPMADRLLQGASKAEVDYFRRYVPLGRFARPSEIADAVAYLSSSSASFANGVIYSLDGGATAGFYTPAA